jgi:hypothetical protein
MFDNEEEYVAVDDERVYMQVPHTAPSSNAQTNETTDDDNFVPFPAEGDIPFEVEVNDVDPEEIQVIHDPDRGRLKVPKHCSL